MKKFITAFLFLIASVCFCQTDTIPFTIDLSHSKFKFESASKELYFYTVGGVSYTNENIDSIESSFYIRVMPSVGDIKKASHAKLKENTEITITKTKEQKLEINGAEAYEILFSGKLLDKKPYKAYQLIVSNSKTALLFNGLTSGNFDATIEEFKRITKSLRIK